MKLEKEVILTGIDNQKITFTLHSVLSAYESEKIERFYVENLTPPDNKKFSSDKKKKEYIARKAGEMKGKLLYGYGDRKMETVVKGWDKKLKLTPTNIKKSLMKNEYAKLMSEVDSILDSSGLSDEKKSTSEKRSSSPSPSKKR